MISYNLSMSAHLKFIHKFLFCHLETDLQQNAVKVQEIKDLYGIYRMIQKSSIFTFLYFTAF